MKPTSDERREVAWRLRSEVSEGECIDYAVCRIINDVLGVNGAWGDKAARILADLIDPTCEMVVKNGRTYCGKCGRMLECEIEDDCYKFTPFCPGCGVRVVADDGK